MFRRILTRSLVPLLIITCAGFVLLLGTAHFGLVSGEEFAPDTFERRTYWYYELPLIRLKITPVWRDVQRNQLETMLVAGKYIVPQSPPKRWDLITAQRGGSEWRQGDAQILCHYLDAWDPEKNLTSFWETWTSDHPALAKVLWPEIVKLAQRDLYFLIPALFETTLGNDKPQPLQNDLNQVLARNYDVLAAAEAELRNWKTAVRFYSDALDYQAGRASSLQGRAVCYEELGKTEEAARDRQAVPIQAEQHP